MERLYAIQQAILQLDGAAFQNLADSYINLKYNIIGLSCIGSQIGSRQTIKGTPDSLCILKDGSIMFVESTKQKTGLIDKLKDDIKKCIDNKGANSIDSKQLKITLVFSQRLDEPELLELKSYCESNGIQYELIGLDTLAYDILTKYAVLASEFLGIPMTSNQIVPLDHYVQLYSHKANNIATPLDTQFFGREEDLKKITERLESSDLVILTGQPGVGKTRLAIEAVREYKKTHNEYSLVAFIDKDCEFGNDLAYLEERIILFIDDANNVEKLKSLLKSLLLSREGNAKIILTTRAYSCSEVCKCAEGLQFEKLNIESLSSTDVEKIIEAEPFGIKNFNYRSRISSLADGNARLAVMCARVAIEKQSDFLFKDVADIYNQYFASFDNEVNMIDDSWASLGILSFFRKMSLNQDSTSNEVLRAMGITHDTFVRVMKSLYKKELVDIQYGHVVISDQIFATYCFYRVFFKENILSLSELMRLYFDRYKHLFGKTLDPIFSAYGNDKVMPILEPCLDDYLKNNSDNPNALMQFYDVFWALKPEATIDFVYKAVNSLPEPEKGLGYDVKYEHNYYAFHHNPYLNLCANFFRHHSSHLETIVLLCLEYCRKQSTSMPELAYLLKENIGLSPHDSIHSYYRQRIIVETIARRLKEDGGDFVLDLFLFVCKELLNFEFSSNEGKGGKITLYRMQLPQDEDVENIRHFIWDELIDLYKGNKEKIIDLLYTYSKNYSKDESIALSQDWQKLSIFIKDILDPSTLEENVLAHFLINRIQKACPEINVTPFIKQYSTKEYSSYHTFCKKEENEDCSLFHCKSDQEIRDLFAMLDVAHKRHLNYFSFSGKLDDIVTSNFILNQEIGIKIYLQAVERYEDFSPYRIMAAIVKHDKVEDVWYALEKLKIDTNKINSMRAKIINFAYDYSTKYEKMLYSLINTNLGRIYLAPNVISNSNNPKKILECIYAANLDERCKIEINDQVFDNLDFFENDYQLISQMYFQQASLSPKQHYDYLGRVFANIYASYPIFLFDLVSTLYINEKRLEPQGVFCNIWADPINLEIIHKTFDLLCSKSRNSWILDDEALCLLFPYEMSAEQKERAISVLLSYAEKSYTDDHKYNCIVNVVRKYFSNSLEKLLLNFLMHSPTLEKFIKMDWISNSASYSGDQTAGNIWKQQWIHIKKIVENAPNKLATIPIIAHIQYLIDAYGKQDYEERGRNFGERLLL